MNIFDDKINSYRDILDSHLIDIYKTGPESLREPINHTLSGKGKRFRPILTLIIADIKCLHPAHIIIPLSSPGNLNLGIFKTYLVILKFVLMISIMSLMAYSTTLTSYKFMNNQRVTLDLELYFYPFYFICSIGMWLSVFAIIIWFIKTVFKSNSKEEEL